VVKKQERENVRTPRPLLREDSRVASH